MATSLAPLGNDDVRTDIDRLSGLVKVSDLDDQPRSRLADLLGERARVAERQHDRRWPSAQDLLESGTLECPGEKADAPWSVGLAKCQLDLPLAPVELFAASADKSQATSVTDGGCQGTSGAPAHRRQCHGVLD
jgi:hypothetical protein